MNVPMGSTYNKQEPVVEGWIHSTSQRRRNKLLTQFSFAFRSNCRGRPQRNYKFLSWSADYSDCNRIDKD
ncbi:unnamed protein product [Rhodiola kirilowii]